MAKHFVWNNCDSTYCNFLIIKLRHRYFSATKFSEQASLNHLQEHIILLMSKSDHMLVRIVYKKADMWYIKWQLVTTSGTTSDNEWQRVTTNGNEWQRMTTSGTVNDNEGQRVVQWVTTSGTTNDNEWSDEWKQMRVILRFRMKQLCNVKLQYTQQRLFENKHNICRSSHRSCSIKKLLFATLQYSQESTWRPAILLKRDSNVSVFLWTLQNF